MGRGISAGLTVGGLIVSALLVTGAAMAQEQAEVPPGWFLAEDASSCTASYEFADLGGTNRSATLEIIRSYRKEAERPVRLRMPLDYNVGFAGVISATLHIDGEAAVLASGRVVADASKTGSVGRFTFNTNGLDRLGSGSGTALKLVVRSAGSELDSFTAALPPTDQVTFDACFDRVGAKLTADDRTAVAKTVGFPKPPVPKGNPGRWIVTNDYPSRALRDNAEGRAVIRLSISRYGFPVQCIVIVSSGSDLLDRTTCRRMLQRAEFYPARDAAYQAVEGSYAQAVTWAIPQ